MLLISLCMSCINGFICPNKFSIFPIFPVALQHMGSSCREKVSNLFKDEGNALQKDKDWERAKSLYSLSISANPANAASWSNRAYMNIQV